MALKKILPLGFDDYRVKAEVYEAYKRGSLEDNKDDLVLAWWHEQLCQAVKIARLQMFIESLAYELSHGLIAAHEAIEAAKRYGA